MTKTLDTRLMPALNTTDTIPTTGTLRREVKSMALFEPRRRRDARAWDELSQIDRDVLLESVRQRRKAQEQKQKIYTEIYGLRANR